LFLAYSLACLLAYSLALRSLTKRCVLLAVPQWSVNDVGLWCRTIGMERLVGIAQRLAIDGDVLLRISDEELNSFVLLSQQNLLNYVRAKIEELRSTVVSDG